MSTEDTLRARLNLVLECGVTQRKLADKLGVSETWLSRWLANKPGQHVRAINVNEMDRFEEYLQECLTKLGAAPKETQRADATAGPTFQGDTRGKTGTDH